MLELFIILSGLRLVLSLVRLGVRVLALAAETAVGVLGLAMRAAGAAFLVMAPPLARGARVTAQVTARVARERGGPAVIAGCVWLGERVFDAAGAAHRTARQLTRRLVHRTASGPASGGRAGDA